MNHLYVIGNGFDLAHGLKTTYWDFRRYLEKYAENFLIEFERMYGIVPIDESDWRVQKRLYKIRIERDSYIKSILWQNFEHDLAMVDEDSMLGFSSSIVDSLDLDSGLAGIEDTLNVYWDEQFSFVQELQEHLYRWIRQVRLFKAKQNKVAFVNNHSDLFLSFNYTNTLERIYHVNSRNVVHIHGGLPPYCYDKPIIGHGATDKIKNNRRIANEASEKFDEATTSIYEAIANYYDRTLKDTRRLILSHHNFFSQLNTVELVTIFGHSMGSVDHPYFKTILQSIPKGTGWIIYYHSPGERGAFCDSLKQIGVPKALYSLKQSSEFWH